MSNDNSARIHVTKSFPVRKEVLYKAWTEPEQLKQWWKPMDKQLVNIDNDIREGGKVVYQFEDNTQIKGEYKEVAEGNRLVYSWIWEFPEESIQKGEYLLTVQFEETGNSSNLVVTQENFKDEHAVKPHQSGWDEALEDLNEHLSNLNA